MILSPGFRKILTTGSMIILVLLGCVFFIDWLLIGKIETMSEKYLENKKTIEKLSLRKSLTRKLEDDLKNNKASLSKLSDVFLNPDNTVDFIQDLEKIAEKTNNEFEITKAVEGSDPKDGMSHSNLDFQISLKGNFNNLINFLANLEDTPYPPYRLIEIENIVIHQTGGLREEESSGRIETVIDIKVYTYES